jgi:hypothetical protein
MSKPEPVELPEGDGPPAAYAAAEEPVALRVRLIDDERTPEGMVCMATYHDTRLIARYVMPPEMWAQVSDQPARTRGARGPGGLTWAAVPKHALQHAPGLTGRTRQEAEMGISVPGQL